MNYLNKILRKSGGASNKTVAAGSGNEEDLKKGIASESSDKLSLCNSIPSTPTRSVVDTDTTTDYESADEGPEVVLDVSQLSNDLKKLHLTTEPKNLTVVSSENNVLVNKLPLSPAESSIYISSPDSDEVSTSWPTVIEKTIVSEINKDEGEFVLFKDSQDLNSALEEKFIEINLQSDQITLNPLDNKVRERYSDESNLKSDCDHVNLDTDVQSDSCNSTTVKEDSVGFKQIETNCTHLQKTLVSDDGLPLKNAEAGGKCNLKTSLLPKFEKSKQDKGKETTNKEGTSVNVEPAKCDGEKVNSSDIVITDSPPALEKLFQTSQDINSISEPILIKNSDNFTDSNNTLPNSCVSNSFVEINLNKDYADRGYEVNTNLPELKENNESHSEDQQKDNRSLCLNFDVDTQESCEIDRSFNDNIIEDKLNLDENSEIFDTKQQNEFIPTESSAVGAPLSSPDSNDFERLDHFNLEFKNLSNTNLECESFGISIRSTINNYKQPDSNLSLTSESKSSLNKCVVVKEEIESLKRDNSREHIEEFSPLNISSASEIELQENIEHCKAVLLEELNETLENCDSAENSGKESKEDSVIIIHKSLNKFSSNEENIECQVNCKEINDTFVEIEESLSLKESVSGKKDSIASCESSVVESTCVDNSHLSREDIVIEKPCTKLTSIPSLVDHQPVDCKEVVIVNDALEGLKEQIEEIINDATHIVSERKNLLKDKIIEKDVSNVFPENNISELSDDFPNFNKKNQIEESLRELISVQENFNKKNQIEESLRELTSVQENSYCFTDDSNCLLKETPNDEIPLDIIRDADDVNQDINCIKLNKSLEINKNSQTAESKSVVDNISSHNFVLDESLGETSSSGSITGAIFNNIARVAGNIVKVIKNEKVSITDDSIDAPNKTNLTHEVNEECDNKDNYFNSSLPREVTERKEEINSVSLDNLPNNQYSIISGQQENKNIVFHTAAEKEKENSAVENIEENNGASVCEFETEDKVVIKETEFNVSFKEEADEIASCIEKIALTDEECFMNELVNDEQFKEVESLSSVKNSSITKYQNLDKLESETTEIKTFLEQKKEIINLSEEVLTTKNALHDSLSSISLLASQLSPTGSLQDFTPLNVSLTKEILPNHLNRSYRDLSELIATCSKQERELADYKVVDPDVELFNSSFKEQAAKIGQDLLMAEEFSEQDVINQRMMQPPPSADINNSEAGPITADEDFHKGEFFQDAAVVDFDLTPIRLAPSLARQSLYIKFDPLVEAALATRSRSEESSDLSILSSAMADIKISSDEGVEVEKSPKRDRSKASELKESQTLIMINTPGKPATDLSENDKLNNSSPGNTPSNTTRRTLTGTGGTPSLRQEVSKLQDLMLEQEQAYVEQLAEKNDLIDTLRKRIAELESKEPREDLEDRLKARELESVKQRKELNENTVSNKQLLTVMEEYEKAIASSVRRREDEKIEFEKIKEKIAGERDSALQHLSNMEVAFNDIHLKYERCKNLIETLHNNEKVLKQTVEKQEKAIEQEKQNYAKLKQHAADRVLAANQEIAAAHKSYQAEIAKMKAVTKKAELKVKSLEESIEQKKKEIGELTQICDELIGKVSGQ